MKNRSGDCVRILIAALFALCALASVGTPPVLAGAPIQSGQSSEMQTSRQPTVSFGTFRASVTEVSTCPNPTPVAQGMTAALINPSEAVSGAIDATGCDIGVYFGPGTRGSVTKADVHGAGSFGVFSNGAYVNVTDSQIHEIRGSDDACGDESSEDDSCSGGSDSDKVKKYIGGRHGTGILFLGADATGVISGNQIFDYGKRGISVSGLGARVQIVGNTITGQMGGSAGGKHSGFTGVWVANGGSGTIAYNQISDNSSGTSEGSPSMGIMVVGGSGHDGMPNYSTGLQIIGNTLTSNDVGVFLSNIPIDANVPTRNHLANNALRATAGTANDQMGADGTPRFAAIKDVGGNGDSFDENTISGYATPIYFTPTQYTHHASLADVRQSRAFTTGIQIQNPNATLINLAVVYRSQSDTHVSSQALQVGPNSSVTLFGTTLAVADGFVGSAVISADQPVQVVANLLGTNPPSGEAYDGVANPTNVVKVPLFHQENGGFDTAIDILNSAATPNTVTVTFNENGTDRAPLTFTLPANGRITVDKTNDGITTKFVGSATVSAQQPVVVEVDQSNGAILLADSGMGTGSPTLYAPLIMNQNNGWTTGLQVQNGGSQATTVSLYLNGSTTTVATAALAPGQSVTWYPVPGTTSASKFVGSATVTSSNGQPLFGIVNELNSEAGQGMAYTPFGEGSRIVDMPLLMDDNNGYDTGEQIQNVGAVAATVDFSVNGVVVDTRVIQPGQSTTWYGTRLLPIGTKVAAGSAVAREEGARIVGIVNEVTAPQRAGDTSFVYEAFNR